MGSVKNSIGKPVNSATITLNSTESGILSYAISNNSGNFELFFKASQSDTLILKVRNLGYWEFSEIIIPNNELIIEKKIVLYHKEENLEEVLVVESQRQMTANKDTVTYNLNFYTDKNEQTVEDVLKKLPGIEVKEDGTIKYGNREISKMLIDGDDLVDDQYIILSKNLDSNLLENVQVLRNYDDNPLRKRFGEGNEVAINLTIKEDKKNIIFGKASLGAGTNGRYNLASNLGLLRERFKTLNLNNINNNGNLNGQQSEYQNIALQDLWSRNSKKEASTFSLIDNEVNTPGFLKPDRAIAFKKL